VKSSSHARTAAECRGLNALRNRYAPADTTKKLAVLRAIARHGVRLRTFAALELLHDDLLFVRAFPDSHDVHAAACAALRRIEPALRSLSPSQRARADDTGMAGSTATYPPPFDVARWMVARWPRDIEFDWDGIDDTSGIDTLIRPLLHRAEEDGFENGDFTTQEWLNIERDVRTESALHWLLTSAARAPIHPSVYRAMYEAEEPRVRWSLSGSPAAVTHNALAVSDVVVRSGFRRPDPDSIRAIAEPLPGITRLDAAGGAAVIDVARAALATRCRDVYAFAHANPCEVWTAPLGLGVVLAILGVVPDDRLSLESNYGYLLLSNGVPVGYGGVTPLFHQANTGINIFAPFRGSEAAFLWQQMLRAFHALFGVTRFVVDAVQFGEDNEEAIASGAYWFYWRMGFRPPDRALRARAEREAARLSRSRHLKSSAATLRALAHGTMQLVLPEGASYPFFDESWLSRCSKGVAHLLAQTSRHHHEQAAASITNDVANLLGVSPHTFATEFTQNERDAFTRLAPVVQLCGTAASASADARQSLVELMRAKGGDAEHAYVWLASKHPTFFRTVYDYCSSHR